MTPFYLIQVCSVVLSHACDHAIRLLWLRFGTVRFRISRFQILRYVYTRTLRTFSRAAPFHAIFYYSVY